MTRFKGIATERRKKMNNKIKNTDLLERKFSIYNPFSKIVTIKTDKSTYKINDKENGLVCFY